MVVKLRVLESVGNFIVKRGAFSLYKKNCTGDLFWYSVTFLRSLDACFVCLRYAGLIVFSDVLVPRRLDFCNVTQGFQECLDGRCYRINKKCDGILDCEDGTDEANCKSLSELTVQLSGES